jgi:hypothetical protein
MAIAAGTWIGVIGTGSETTNAAAMPSGVELCNGTIVTTGDVATTGSTFRTGATGVAAGTGRVAGTGASAGTDADSKTVGFSAAVGATVTEVVTDFDGAAAGAADHLPFFSKYANNESIVGTSSINWRNVIRTPKALLIRWLNWIKNNESNPSSRNVPLGFNSSKSKPEASRKILASDVRACWALEFIVLSDTLEVLLVLEIF